MAANYEMLSFIEKFNQMTTCGFNAKLNFSCNNGRVSVQLSADLGCLYPGLYPYPRTASFSNQESVKPSKVKRRQRRAQARNERSTVVAEIDTNNEPTETIVEATSSLSNSNVEDTTNELEPIPSDELAVLPNSVDDSNIDYFLPSNTSLLKDNSTMLTSTSTQMKLCCPCCSTSKSPARNCPGKDVAQTTYIRCCYHK